MRCGKGLGCEQMILECDGCWKGVYDVETEHKIKGEIATCTICGTPQDIELLTDSKGSEKE